MCTTMYLHILSKTFELLQMYLFLLYIITITGQAKSCDPEQK